MTHFPRAESSRSNTHLFAETTAGDSSLIACSARSVIRAPPSIRTAPHARRPSRRDSSSGSTILRQDRARGRRERRHRCILIDAFQTVGVSRWQPAKRPAVFFHPHCTSKKFPEWWIGTVASIWHAQASVNVSVSGTRIPPLFKHHSSTLKLGIPPLGP